MNSNWMSDSSQSDISTEETANLNQLHSNHHSNQHHSNQSSVVVYILSDSNDRGRKVNELFSNRMFKVNMMKIDPPKEMKSGDKDALEGYQTQWCLDDARKKYPSSPVLVVRDSSVSNASPSRIAEVVSSALKSGQWDLFYLCRWMDRCDLHSDKKSIRSLPTQIAKTQSPHGLQAVMYSPSGRDTVLGLKQMKNGKHLTPLNKSLSDSLNQAISEGNLTARTTVPNLIDYDISNAKNSNDYLKTTQCMADQSNSFAQQSNNYWIWIILIIIVLIIVFWALSRKK